MASQGRSAGRTNIAGKRVIVTGGASGIGQATAELVASRGGFPFILDIDADRGRLVANAIAARGDPVEFLTVDLSDESQVAAAVAHAVQSLGGIDALIHCAGVMEGQGVPIQDLGTDTWNRVLAVNLTGAYLASKFAALPMIRAKSGVIVLVASVGGVVSGSGSYAYGASKGGVHGLGLTLDHHLAGEGIRVHVVCPDGIDTPLYQRSMAEGVARGIDPRSFDGPIGTSEDTAALLVTLVSDDANYFPLTIVARPRTVPG